MANVLGAYSPEFFASEALLQLRNALGMAGRIHRGFENERRGYGLGEVITIRKPGRFSVTDGGAGTVQEVKTQTVQIELSQHKEVMFGLTDKELAYTGKRIIDEHVQPAAYELANYIDEVLNELYVDIPWYAEAGATPGIASIAKARRVLRENGVPLGTPMFNHFEAGPYLEEQFLSASEFVQHQGAGDQGVSAQMQGQLGTKLGFNIFANQNVQTHVAGALVVTGAFTADAAAVGATQLTLTAATSLTGTVKKGDSIKIAGDRQRYVVTADATAVTPSVTVSIFPALQVATTGAEVVTARQASQVENLMFHRNAFALAMAPLPDFEGHSASSHMFTASDETTGLSIRAAQWWDGTNKEYRVSLDVLFGLKTLDPNMAVRVNHAVA